MDLNDLIRTYGSQAQLAEALGIDRHQLNRVVKGRRPMGAAMAVQIFKLTGHRLGPLADAAGKAA